MFGLFYLFFVIGIIIISNLQIIFKNGHKRQKAITNNQETYLDNWGCERLVSNNKKVMKSLVYTKNECSNEPDYVLLSVDDSKIVINYSENKRNECEKQCIQKAQNNGKTVYRLGTINDDNRNSKIVGYRYKDFNTGQIYVIRKINGKLFYMDINTGLLTRETDGQLILTELKKKEKSFPYDKEYTSLENQLIAETLYPEKLIIRLNKEQEEHYNKWGYINYRNNLCYCGGLDWNED